MKQNILLTVNSFYELKMNLEQDLIQDIVKKF